MTYAGSALCVTVNKLLDELDAEPEPALSALVRACAESLRVTHNHALFTEAQAEELPDSRHQDVDLSGLEAVVDHACDTIDQLRAERDDLRRHRDELVQLVSEALEALHENPSVTQIDLRDWIKSAKAAIAATTAVQA
jgi:hypothetical protein